MLRRMLEPSPELSSSWAGLLDDLMTYGTFRKATVIGSGVGEAGCKTAVGKCMKGSGMFWSEAGGQGILDLRCAAAPF